MRAVQRRQRASQNIYTDFAQWAANAPTRLDTLYSSPYAVQCIYRALPPVARIYVARVLYLPPEDAAIPASRFRSAIRSRQRARDRHDAAMETLRTLRVFVQQQHTPQHMAEGGAADVVLVLNPTFGRQLRLLAAGNAAPVFGGPLKASAPQDELESFAARRLERILNYPIGSEDADAGGVVDQPGSAIRASLISAQILETCGDGAAMRITSHGFQFLLRDTNAQVWILLRDIINHQFAGAEFEALDFVFQLSFASIGRAYSTESLVPVQAKLAPILDELGVIRLHEADGMFFPTPRGVRLVSSASRMELGAQSMAKMLSGTGVGARGDQDMRVIVETNFRVYAYTKSAFQMNLLRLFTHLRYRLPNLVVGHITRDAVREALMIGITADQIIGYLNAHAHPRMKRGTIPGTVRDEIKLWEVEQERVQMNPGVLLSDFDSAQHFSSVYEYAQDLGACMWANVPNRQIVVAKTEYEQVRKHIRASANR